MNNQTNVINFISQEKTPLLQHHIGKAKISFNARRVDLSQAKFLTTEAKPSIGDLVLARVEKLGQHTNIHMVSGRRARLYEGDTVLLAYANRYATDQFEAHIPSKLSPCHMAAAGGVASKVISRNSSMKNPTAIRPLGLLTDANGEIMNTSDWALPKMRMPHNRKATVIVVVGTEMNAGKTTTAASIVRGGAAADICVGAAKITGTGAAGDYCEMVDAGATHVFDLIDAGYPSTFKLPHGKVLQIFETLTARLIDMGSDLVVLEIADGLLQQETKMLLSDPVFQSNIDSVVLAAGDVLAAKAGVDYLESINLPLVGVSGKLTASNIGKIACEEATRCAVFDRKMLCNPETMPFLLPRLGHDSARNS